MKSNSQLSLLKLLIAIFAMVWLSACSHPQQPQMSPEFLREMKVAELSQKLERKGVRVVQVGQSMRILIPSDRLFNPASANFNRGYASSVLDIVSQLMLILQTTSAEVLAYTNTEPSQMFNRALSTRQAQVVIDYLWQKGVDARMLYARGYGAKGVVVSTPNSKKQASLNRRIEIEFQYLPLLSSVNYF